MELLGRDSQLVAAARAIGDVRRGSGRALGLLGETGLGKSALLAEIGERSRAAGLPVLAGRGCEHERDVPFGVIVDAVGDAAGAPDQVPAAERFRRHRAIAARLQEIRPAALLLDDLHWADDASVELVLHLLRRPVPVPILLVIAARPVGPAARLLDAARCAPGWEQLALDPLDDEHARALVAGVADPAVRDRVVREGRGNPLFLRELARVADRGDGALPGTLVAAVGLEVAALAPTARALAEGAAVAGDPFDPELAAAAAGLDAAGALAALDELVAADLVRPTGGAAAGRAFAFRHPLVRRAVYDGTAPAWRLCAHERTATALERRGAGPVARAFHLVRSAHVGDEAAIDVIVAAGTAAGAASPAAAGHWYGSALRLVPDRARERRAQLLTLRAGALAGAGRLHESREALLEALALAPSLELVLHCARVESTLGLHAEARRRLLAADAEASADARPGLALELAAGAFWEGRAELRRWADPAVEATRDAPLLLTGAEALAALGALWDADPVACEAALDRASEGLDGLPDAGLLTCPVVMFFVAVAQLLAERFGAAAATGARGLALMRRSGRTELLVTLLCVRAMALRLNLELEAAATEAEAAEEAARLQELPHLLQFALWVRALVHDARGEASAAEAVVREGVRVTRTIEPTKLSRTAACDFGAFEPDPERAMRAMTAAAGPALEHADPTWQTWLLLRLVRAALAAGDGDEAERLAEHAAAYAERLRLPAGAVRAAAARAEVLLARGDAVAAAALAQQAAQRGEAPLDALDAALLAGRALAAAGDERARGVLQRVAADAARAGARGIHDAAGRELRRLGSRVAASARRAARRDSALSERERQIAALVSDGRSNKQVAAALFLSEKTIENALTTIYAKLGVRSRVELSLRFHLDRPAGVEQRVDDHHRGGRPDAGEDLAVRRHRALGVGGRRQQRAGADDVGRGRARLGESGEDDLPAAAGLFGG